jgi:membrane-bound serine protease (ClpP class)
LIALFFFGHLLAGLAGWEDAALVVLGLVLIAVELFVIPGFGVAGVLGVVALLGGMYLAMVGREVRTPEVTAQAGWTVVATLAGLVVGLIAIVALLPRGSRFGGLVLQANVDGTAAAGAASARKPGGWLRLFGGNSPLDRDRARARSTDSGERVASAPPSLTSHTGVALTDLRPSGAAEIDGQRVDVVSDGPFVPAGSPVIVVRDEGYRRVVRRVASGE